MAAANPAEILVGLGFQVLGCSSLNILEYYLLKTLKCSVNVPSAEVFRPRRGDGELRGEIINT